MKHIFGVGFVVFGLLVPIVGSAADVAAIQADPAAKRYVYKHSEGKPLGIEVFSPKDHDPATRKVAGIILFHGGNWTDGSPAEFHDVCRYFASRGLVAATADYRTLPAHGPDKDKDSKTGLTRKQICVRDAKSAIRWFKEYAEALGVDPTRIVAGGGSAGGHIAVLASTTPDLDDPTDPPGIDTSVAASMLWAPACTEADADDPPIDARRHVGKNFAPAVVFFGTEDSWLRHWKNLTQYSIRPRGGAEPIVWFAQGGDHEVFGKPDWRLATIAAADQFLVDRGLLAGESTLPASPGGKTLTPSAAITGQ
ncbi:MAG: alpha/beta hydrolase [Planctomycetia bacterium]|nr:alpha/beta hydrolase [Planctomycetia bacterium]